MINKPPTPCKTVNDSPSNMIALIVAKIGMVCNMVTVFQAGNSLSASLTVKNPKAKFVKTYTASTDTMYAEGLLTGRVDGNINKNGTNTIAPINKRRAATCNGGITRVSFLRGVKA